MATPAPTFFALLGSVRQIKREETAVQLREFCDIAAISWGDEKYFRSLKASYSEMALPPEKLAARKNPRVFDVNNKERADAAANLIASFLGQKKRMENGVVNGRQ